MAHHKNSAPLIMPVPLLFSLLGIAFCAWYAWGNSIDLCMGAACKINEDMNLGGVSLWWYGCTAFALLTIASFSGRPGLGFFLAGICLLCDIALLVLMLAIAPCISCLIVALLFALIFLSFRHTYLFQEKKGHSFLLYIWLALFLINCGAVVRENFSPWAIFAPAKGAPAISVYFSPSCVSCRDAVAAFADNDKVAFYPVAEKEEDTVQIAHMLTAIEEKKTLLAALESVREKIEKKEAMENPFGFFDSARLQFNLLINKAYVLRAGSVVVPFIEYKGLPAFLLPQKQEEQAKISEVQTVRPLEPVPDFIPDPNSATEEFLPEYVPPTSVQSDYEDPALPIDTGIAGACGGENTAPCPE